MSAPVSIELWIFLWSICSGIILGFIFDIFRIKRRVVKTGLVLTTIEDLLFWILAALILFITVYLSNDGEIRGFTIIGCILGAVFYFSAISPIILRVAVTVIEAVKRAVRFIVKVIMWPIEKIVGFLKPLVIYYAKWMKNLWGKCTAAIKTGTKSFCAKGLANIKKIKKKKINKEEGN